MEKLKALAEILFDIGVTEIVLSMHEMDYYNLQVELADYYQISESSKTQESDRIQSWHYMNITFHFNIQ